MASPPVVGLDFETYSAVDIKDVGLDNYFAHPSTVVLIGAIAHADGRETQYDFVDSPLGRDSQVQALRASVKDKYIIAHNAMFEWYCLRHLGIIIDLSMMIDSAMLARMHGAESALEQAAPQLTNRMKDAKGAAYIRRFSQPNKKYQRPGESMVFDTQVIRDHPADWTGFMRYCRLDASLGLEIWEHAWGQDQLLELEYFNDTITRRMNYTGWNVDMTLVHEMQRQYEANLKQIEQEFRANNDAPDLNLNSHQQLQKWCKERGINAKSFDVQAVESMIKRIEKQLANHSLTAAKSLGYRSVLDLLYTKQALGGSSLKKLDVLRRTVSADGRLRNQYMHAGAGQTMRTSGRGVQLQNLKRFTGQGPADMDDIWSRAWSNDELADNLRQAFIASHPDGLLLVGDFSSVESRGLAWLAGEQYKLTAYAQGKDMYKVLAASPEMFNCKYEDVTKEQRQTGKVGELSCGYQAGAGAVQSFAEKMGVEMTEAEAATLVSNWRAANPNIVAFWKELDDMLRDIVSGHRNQRETRIGPRQLTGWKLVLKAVPSPSSLVAQLAKDGVTGHTTSMWLEIWDGTRLYMRRVFHGLHEYGREIRYYKPSSRKTGDLWKKTYVNPKTKKTEHYTLYGGKLAGITTQSFCREIFFECLRGMATFLGKGSWHATKLIGQFHDEIVVDWSPSVDGVTSEQAIVSMEKSMSHCSVPYFPLAAEVKFDYRYTK